MYKVHSLDYTLSVYTHPYPSILLDPVQIYQSIHLQLLSTLSSIPISPQFTAYTSFLITTNLISILTTLFLNFFPLFDITAPPSSRQSTLKFHFEILPKNLQSSTHWFHTISVPDNILRNRNRHKGLTRAENGSLGLKRTHNRAHWAQKDSLG